ncbi:tyrosine--tRNA ligase, mitochondrial isoform X2 [Periplaneta americana]|uniref:tyrosine--tRNA ligase, mitochondrial isoform X2 n=1 Tax=Periplaneta americana TaxID=6978 RepID=UPI0037E9B2D1
MNKYRQEVIDLLNASPQCVYAGFDPTSDSLHVGNLLVLMNLLHWQRGGHKVIALVGGATGRIGDPSGRTTERPELQPTFIHDNVHMIKKNIQCIFNNHEQYIWKKNISSRTLIPPMIVDNLEWYTQQNVVDFVSHVGRHFRLGTMLSRHSVQSRLSSEVGMSFTEFCYQLFQAYDWLHLLQKYNCKFQVGGSDQMGNIVSGHDLISRVADVKVYGLTLPLVTTETGHKFGKSEDNAVWLDANKSSPFELYQFFVRCRDSEVEKLLKLFTFQSSGKIEDIMFKHQRNPEHRIAQKILAEQVTLLVHGEQGLEMALKSTSALYDHNIESLVQLKAQDISSIFQGAKTCELLLEPGTTTLEVALKAGCFTNERDAVRIISAGGFYINHQRVTKTDEVLTDAVHILPNNVTLIRVGKKNYYVVRWLK